MRNAGRTTGGHHARSRRRSSAAALIALAMALAGPQAVGPALADDGSVDVSGDLSAGVPAPSGSRTGGRSRRPAPPESGQHPPAGPPRGRGSEGPAGRRVPSAALRGDSPVPKVPPTMPAAAKISAPAAPAPAAAKAAPARPAALTDATESAPVRPVPMAPPRTVVAAQVTPAPASPSTATAPVMTAPKPAAAIGTVESVLTSLVGSNPGTPVESPLSWTVLATVRRQPRAPRTAVGPAAASAATNRSPVIGSVVLSTPDAVTGALRGTVKASDPNGDRITYRATTSANGTVTITAGGAFTYTPTANARHRAAKVGASTAATTDTVTVTVTDAKGAYVTKSVAVPISPKNTAPTATVSIAAPDPVSGIAKGAVRATDADNDSLTYAASKPANGTVAVNADGTFSYTPTTTARTAARTSISTSTSTSTRTDSFMITVSDGYGGSKVLGVTAIIAPANPVLQVVEAQGSVSLLRDATTGIAYVQSAGSPAVAVTRADSYWTGPVPVTRGGATLLGAVRDSSGKLRVLDTSSYGQFGWILNESGLFTGEEKYTASTLPGAETLFGLDLDNDGAIGSAPPGGTTTPAPGSFPMSLVNGTGGAYRDDQIFVTFLGQTTPGTWSWIDADGQAHRLDHTAADAPGHLVKNGINYADMSFTVAEAAGLPIPPTVQAGRVYVSVGEPLYIRISPDDAGWAGPSPTNPADPNFATAFDWYEMSYSNGRTAFGGNTTQVDQFGLPLTVTLEQTATGFSQTRGLPLTGDEVFTRYIQSVPPEFGSLIIRDTAGNPLRIVAPRTMQPAALATWLDAPVNDFWTKYRAEPFTYAGAGYTVTGRVDANSQFAYTVTAAGVSTPYTMRKPTTAEIFACDGPFVGAAQQGAFLAELSAAFNRGVAGNPAQWNDAATYYPAGQRWNAYAKFFHDISTGHYAYGFPYDDVNSQSSVQILGNTAPPSRLTISVLAGRNTGTSVPAPTGGVDPRVWTLSWADEFNTPNAKPDPTKWGYDIGGGGYGNAELQYYTDRTQNVSTDAAGRLVITAIKENLPGSGCWYGTCQYTSGRILTKNLFTQQYGRFEASVKLPAGQGMWPAFWMQGDATGSAGTSWPARGELDIMENIGREPSTVHGSLHGPGYSGANAVTGSYTLPAGQRFSDAFHTFAVEWDPNQIRWYVDDTLYEARTRADLPAGTTWVFDHPFYLILNSAVGGQWPGSPDATSAFPQQMLIDYVRVYTRATAPVA